MLTEKLAEAKRELHLVQRQLEQYQTKQQMSLHERRLRALEKYQSDWKENRFRYYHLNGQAGNATCYDELPDEVKNHDSGSSEDEIG